MRLVTFSSEKPACTAHPGVLWPLGAAVNAHTHVVDLVAAFAADGGPALAGGTRELLSMPAGLDRALKAAKSGQFCIALSDATLLAPISNPEKIICVGMNYHDHCTEQNFPIPKEPVLFSKFAA